MRSLSTYLLYLLLAAMAAFFLYSFNDNSKFGEFAFLVYFVNNLLVIGFVSLGFKRPKNDK